MKSKIILALLFTLFAPSSLAQQASCAFGNRTIGGVSIYTCSLSVINPDRLEITQVVGAHVIGFTDADVLGVARTSGAIETFFPSVFCSRFPNLRRISVASFQLTAITDESFGGCSDLEWLAIYSNNISSISAEAFANNVNLVHLDMGNNLLTTLFNGIFASLSDLVMLDIRNTPFETLSSDVFFGLSSLMTLHMDNTQVASINPEWFLNTPRLSGLFMSNNQLNQVAASDFVHVPQLEILDLYNNNLNTFDPAAFAGLLSLRELNVGANGITSIDESSFAGLGSLESLTLSENTLSIITNGTFRALTSLSHLYLTETNTRQLEADAFDSLIHLDTLILNFNELAELPQGIFASLASITHIGLWSNQLKTLRRSFFSEDLSRLRILDLDSNNVNALERSVFEDAHDLNLVMMRGNICVNAAMSSFIANRERHMQQLERCFSNFDLVIDTVTDNNVEYAFFPGEWPGIVMRVQAEDEIQIALTPFDFSWNPMLEIIIGAGNNTRTVIRRNQEEDVAVIPTPGIIRSGQQNVFRVVWANNVVLAFRDNEEWPFIVYTMVNIVPVNFYGLRTPQSRAVWSIQPVGF